MWGSPWPIGPVNENQISGAIVVVIEERDAATHRLDDVFLYRRGDVFESDAGLRRDVGEPHRPGFLHDLRHRLGLFLFHHLLDLSLLLDLLDLLDRLAHGGGKRKREQQENCERQASHQLPLALAFSFSSREISSWSSPSFLRPAAMYARPS